MLHDIGLHMHLPRLLASFVVVSALALPACAAPAEGAADGDETAAAVSGAAPVKNHLRYLAMNIGNVALTCRRYEYKLCTHDTSERLRRYIATWKPDVILLSEVLDEPQLDRVLHDSDLRAGGSTTSDLGGPVLPPELGYAHVCHANENRDTHVVDDRHPLDDSNASHRHECVAWRKDRLSLVSAAHVYGPNSPALRKKCNYDFTAQAATLRLLGSDDGTGHPIEVTGIAPHPASDSEDVVCRTDTLARMWKQLATGPRVFLGGDFNTGEPSELQVPPTFKTNYSHGSHFTTHHRDEYTVAYYIRGSFEFDHAYASFGKACTTCGRYYGGPAQDLPFGSALGDWDGHPWAAAGIDHRQILVDLDLD
jgi:Endonuclease/Exonuclease/phosphatase family